MDVTLRQLEYAVAVARLGHFGRAAEASLATQPALSAGIAQLEAALGVVLFERGRRGARPTAAGREIIRRAEAVLSGVDDLRDAARAVRGPFTTPLRLGVIPTVAPFVLPSAVPALRAHWPKLRLELREDQTSRLVHLISEGAIDVALLAEEADLGGMETLALYRDPFVLAVPAAHRLAGRTRVGEKVLGREQVLLLEEGHCLRAQALSFCERLGVREAADVRATSLTTLVHMAAGGLGVTLLPAMASSLGAGAGLKLVPFGGRAPARTIVLAFRPTTARRDELRAVAGVLRGRPPAGTIPLRA